MATVDRTAELRKKLARVSVETKQATRTEILRALLNIEAGAKRRVLVRTGKTRNSITHVVSDDGMNGSVGSNDPNAARIEFGTGPHVIEARPGGVLVFPGNARQSIKSRRTTTSKVFTKRVNHPGTRAHPFLLPAFEEERPEFLRRLADAINRANRRLSR